MAHLNSVWKAGLTCCITATLSWSASADPSTGGTWQKYTPTNAVRGADGQSHRATCSGYPGTDKTYSFWAKKGKSDNLVVYFEGGGACWDSLTCTFPIAGLPDAVPQFFVPAVPAGANPAEYSGIFEAANPDNPVKDWSMVYIPYCTGDLHTGSATQTYYNVGHPVFPLPSSFQIEHRGFDNFMVVLDFMRRKFREPEKVLVAGSSAGGYGATANAPWIQRSYPDAKLSVLADASQGVTTPGFDLGNPGQGRKSWNMQLAPWVFGSDPSRISGPDLLRVAAKGLPRAKVGQFTTAYDTVQIGFYGVMKAYYGPGGSCSNLGIDWHNQAVSKVQADSDALSNYHYYVADGGYHTNLRSPQFYAESSAGTPYRDWVSALLGQRQGRLWVDAFCPTCLYQPPCNQ